MSAAFYEGMHKMPLLAFRFLDKYQFVHSLKTPERYWQNQDLNFQKPHQLMLLHFQMNTVCVNVSTTSLSTSSLRCLEKSGLGIFRSSSSTFLFAKIAFNSASAT